MAKKHAGMGAALAVLVIVFGLVTLVGVILLMMWFQPDIDHSPAQVESVMEFRVRPVTPTAKLSNPPRANHLNGGVLA